MVVWGGAGNDPKKTVMEGMSGKITDFSEHVEEPLQIRKSYMCGSGKPRKVNPV